MTMGASYASMIQFMRECSRRPIHVQLPWFACSRPCGGIHAVANTEFKPKIRGDYVGIVFPDLPSQQLCRHLPAKTRRGMQMYSENWPLRIPTLHPYKLTVHSGSLQSLRVVNRVDVREVDILFSFSLTFLHTKVEKPPR